MTPEDSEKSRRRTLPMATTSSPTVTLEESPIGMAWSRRRLAWVDPDQGHVGDFVDAEHGAFETVTRPAPLKVTVTVLTACR